MKIYKLITEMSIYPSEVYTFNPRIDKEKPEWLTDILKLDKIVDGEVKYCESIDDDGGFTYFIPSTCSHLYVNPESILLKSVGSGEVFPMRLSRFNLLYEEVLPKWKRLINRIAKIF